MRLLPQTPSRYLRRFPSTLPLLPQLFRLAFHCSFVFLSFVLPGKWLAEMEEPAVRAVVGECGKLRTRLSALANFHRRVWAAHFGLHPTGVRRVHLDFAVAQFVREMHSEGIERSLRRVVSEGLERVNRRVRIGMKGQRTQDTGNIHNSTGRRFAYEWQQFLCQRNGRKEIRFKSFAQHFRRHRGDGVWP